MRIGIIMPLHNAEKYVEKAIRSVRDQSHQDWTLYIGENGSTDSSYEKAKIFADHDKRIKLFRWNWALGPAGAESRISKHVTEDYVARMDDDDMLHPLCLEECMKAAKLNPGKVIFTRYQEINERGQPIRVPPRNFVDFNPFEILTHFMTFHFRLIPRGVYETVGGANVAKKFADDFDLCLRLSEVADFVRVPKVLYHYRKHKESTSAMNLDGIDAEVEDSINAALRRRLISHMYKVTRSPGRRFQLEPKQRIDLDLAEIKLTT